MKKYVSLAAFIISSALAANAQDEIVIKASKPITKEATPKVVVDSLHKKFPNAEAIQYYKTPSSGVTKGGWTVTKEDELPAGSTLDYYTISFKRDNLKYYGLYKADGTLVMSKEEQKEVALPEPVKASLKKLGSSSDEYKGYKVVSSTYYKTYNYSKKNAYYEVTAEKGNDKKRVIVKPDGTIVKVKG